jgi:hypothetical protein
MGMSKCVLRVLILAAVLLYLGAVSLPAQLMNDEVGLLPLDLRPLARFDASDSQVARPLLLPEGTKVSLESLSYVSSRIARVNDRVRFQVASDVSIEGLTVIPKGSEAWGIVTLVKPPRHFSRDGKLQIGLQSVLLPSGQMVAIRVHVPAWPQTGKWDLREPDSLQAPLLGLVALGIIAIMPPEDQHAVFASLLHGIIGKGEHARHLPGTRIEAEISHDVELKREEFKTPEVVPSGQLP